jgi:hypothetical protein
MSAVLETDPHLAVACSCFSKVLDDRSIEIGFRSDMPEVSLSISIPTSPQIYSTRTEMTDCSIRTRLSSLLSVGSRINEQALESER